MTSLEKSGLKINIEFVSFASVRGTHKLIWNSLSPLKQSL